MAERSLIAWTNSTWNPWMGCTKVSDGCKNCYADTLTTNRMGLHLWGPKGARQVTSDANWRKPFRWHRFAESGTCYYCEGHGSIPPKKPGLDRESCATCNGSGSLGAPYRLRVFCASLCDWAEQADTMPAKYWPIVQDARRRLWDMIRATPWLDWQLLSKRSGSIASMLPDDWGNGYFNVWLGVSVEDNRVAFRADDLRKIPATVRFISYEPAIGPLDQLKLDGIDWVLYGGESGPGYRKEDKQWARDMNARCEAETERRRLAGLTTVCAFFHKQSAAIRTEMGIELDGHIVKNYPNRRVELPVL
jgi:protein gp37